MVNDNADDSWRPTEGKVAIHFANNPSETGIHGNQLPGYVGPVIDIVTIPSREEKERLGIDVFCWVPVSCGTWAWGRIPVAATDDTITMPNDEKHPAEWCPSCFEDYSDHHDD